MCKVEPHCGDLPIIKWETKVTMNLNLGRSQGIGGPFLCLLLASRPRDGIPHTLQKQLSYRPVFLGGIFRDIRCLVHTLQGGCLCIETTMLTLLWCLENMFVFQVSEAIVMTTSRHLFRELCDILL